MAPLSNLINYHIEELKKIDNLSERTKNVCLEGSLDTLYKILYYFLERGTFRDIRNCGLKTDNELIETSKKYLAMSNLTLDDLRMNEPLLGFEDFKLYCYVSFKVPSTITEKFKDSFISKKFPFFNYFQIVLEHVLNERELFIFRNNFGFFGDSQKRTLQSIGDSYDITRERVRQIAQKVPEKIEYIVSKIALRFNNIDKHFNYGIDLKKDIININEDLVKLINHSEGLNFTAKFYALVLGGIFHRSYMSFQDMENNYKNYYLVSRKFKGVYDFKKLYADVEKKLEERIENEYMVNADAYLANFISPDQPLGDRLKTMTRRMISEEFDLGYDKVNLVFHRNTLIKLSEHIMAILKESGRPMKLTEICKELKGRTQRIPPNIESLRSSILSIEEVVAIGKTSTYALAEWQSVKTGTIKELVKEFLVASDEPRHISDITFYVNKFRNTSDKNILSNLKLDKTDKFLFFRKSYIGLKSKKYQQLPEETKGEIRRGRPPKVT
jgi:hypothetical protein